MKALLTRRRTATLVFRSAITRFAHAHGTQAGDIVIHINL